jgi:HlyD family secretion protein
MTTARKNPAIRTKAKPAAIAAALMVIAVVLAGALLQARSRHAAPSALNGPEAPKDSKAASRVVLACPGRVEGASEVIEVGAGVDGVLKRVPVREGQSVAAGETLALVDCAEWEAELGNARAALAAAEQSRLRLVRGSRDEERRMALAARAREEAVREQARLQHERMSKLFASGDISRERFEQARRDLSVAEAAVNAANDHLALVNAPPLPEELAKADAETRAAAERVRAVGERLKKCAVRAPASGTVLRVHRNAGEPVSTLFPQPVVSLADASQMRVRAEVDERDVGRVHPGQRVTVTAPAFAGREFGGRVSRLSALMGRKSVQTGDPAEKSDRDVLEVFVDLEETDARLVVGLRVTVQFLSQ